MDDDIIEIQLLYPISERDIFYFIFFIHYSHGADSAKARLSKALANQDMRGVWFGKV